MNQWLRMGALSGAAGLAVLFGSAFASAEKFTGPGVTDKEIRIGNTMPYSGPASALGNTGKVISAYFKMINDAGGVNGRKIDLRSMDDGFSPPKTVEQTRKLVEDDQVAFMFATMGTAPSSAIQRYLSGKGVPLIFLISSAGKWNDPKNFPLTMAFPWQPPYSTEGRIYLDYMRKNDPKARVAVLYQNDDSGKEYIRGLREALGADADKVIAAAMPFEVTEPTVDSQVLALAATKAEAFMILGVTPRACSQAIRKAWEIGWRPMRFLASSCINPDQILKPAGLDKAEGIITMLSFRTVSADTQNDSKVSGYLDFMKKYAPGIDPTDFYAVYGYTVAGAMTEVLKAAGDNPSRENVMKQAATMKGVALPMLLDGITLNTTPDDYRPLRSGYLARFTGGQWKPFGSLLSGQ
ncbi:branched-chain amino acid ABC transporter substrate-binding protein [Camelimonas fluminis]|uniref:ABC transporter substrate-binding protein n=1 Tax=Camelimonas fluminis TaxID=1576911 RepID=A0ABV7UCH8_9HYPH|nr:branched-chain amino acid ABC transporter substrate-binding protein [Camelimonas fluminis]